MDYFRQLNIWKDSMQLAEALYLLTNNFPDNETLPILLKVLQGAPTRNSDISFLIALGSLFELETQVVLSQELNYVELKASESLVGKIIQLQKMISTFKKTLTD